MVGIHDLTPLDAPPVRGAPRSRRVRCCRAIARNVAGRSLCPGGPPRRARAAAVLRSFALGLGPALLRFLPRPGPCLRPAGRARGDARRQGYAPKCAARRSLTALPAGGPAFTEHFRDSDDEGDASVDNGPTGGLTW